MMKYTYNENMVLVDVKDKTYGELHDVLLVFDKSNNTLCLVDASDKRSKVHNFFYSPKMRSVFD